MARYKETVKICKELYNQCTDGCLVSTTSDELVYQNTSLDIITIWHRYSLPLIDQSMFLSIDFVAVFISILFIYLLFFFLEQS